MSSEWAFVVLDFMFQLISEKMFLHTLIVNLCLSLCFGLEHSSVL